MTWVLCYLTFLAGFLVGLWWSTGPIRPKSNPTNGREW